MTDVDFIEQIILVFIFATAFTFIPFFMIRTSLKYLKGQMDYPFASFADFTKDEEIKKEMNVQDAKIRIIIMSSLFMPLGLLFCFGFAGGLLAGIGIKNKTLVISLAIIFTLSLLIYIISYLYKFWKSNEKIIFSPGEKYIVYSKHVSELKIEIKNWLKLNSIKLIREDNNILEAERSRFQVGTYDVLMYLKLLEVGQDTIVVLDKRLAKNFPFANIFIKDVAREKRKNLIRSLKSGKEIKINYSRFESINAILLFSMIIVIIYLTFKGYVDMNLASFFPIIGLVFLIVRSITFNLKIKRLSNLPEYKLEEYKGEIKID